MTLDQRGNDITGDFPVQVLPYYEPDTKTWGLVWSELSDRPYELTLEATQGGWAHITRMAGSGKGTFVYAIPLQPGERFTLAMDPTRPDAPMQKAGGGTITPLRLGGTGGTPPAGSVLALDEVTPGSLAAWKERYDPAATNPRIGFEEVVSPFDRSTALRTWAKGNTFATCETKWIRRVYATGPQQTTGAVVEAFLAFTFDGTVYNLPSVRLELLDAGGAVVADQVYFGKGIIGSYNRGRLPQTGYRELPAASGLQRLDLAQEFGTDRRFSAVAVTLMNYTCQGENAVVFDHLLLRTKGGATSPSPSPAASRPATPSAGGSVGTGDLAAAFGATPEAFDRDFKGRAIRVSGRFQQVQLTGDNPTVFVRVGDWRIVCAQARSGTSEALARTGLGAPVWISGQMLYVEGNQLWLMPGCVRGTE
jgi:hypothetical protein